MSESGIPEEKNTPADPTEQPAVDDIRNEAADESVESAIGASAVSPDNKPTTDEVITESASPDPEISHTTDTPLADDAPDDKQVVVPEADHEVDSTPTPASASSAPPPVEATSAAAPPTISRTSAPFKLPALLTGLLLIAMGVIFVWPLFSGGYILLPGIILAIGALGVTLSLLGYWLHSGRRARGTLFLALWLLLWGQLTGIFILEPESASIQNNWPLYLITFGVAILLTYAGDRYRDKQLIIPGILLTLAGTTALAFTTNQLPATVSPLVQQFWPWIGFLLVLGLLPMAFRRVPNNQPPD